MLRQIIHIDEEKCNGCGLCAQACHEGAIEMVNGKARLAREDYCDGMGDCLPQCPAGAITFEEREAPAYNEAAVLAAKAKKAAAAEGAGKPSESVSMLSNWPCQIKLAPIFAPYFDGADLLIAADCTAYAYGSFHRDFMAGKVTLIGCPKLDGVDYSEKLSEIFRNNDLKSVTLLRMEVPCCGGLEMAINRALESSGKELPYRVVTISIDGKILSERG